MRKILVATDLSARADRAIRRAILPAKKFEASLHLVHVVDDDRPRRITDPERDAAAEILDEQARSLRDFDGVNCTTSVVLGGLADEIVKATQDAPARKHMALASASRGDLQHYVGSEEADAGRELASFVQRTVAFPARHLVKLRETTAPHAICTVAEEVSADLIVVGTHGRTGIANFLLGSVAQGVLHAADQDVLTISARRD